jgi:hypothetical protein
MIDAFSNIHSNPNGNKNDVIKGLEWQFTSGVNMKYAANGASWPTKAGPAPASTQTTMQSSASSKLTTSPSTGGEGAKCSD